MSTLLSARDRPEAGEAVWRPGPVRRLLQRPVTYWAMAVVLASITGVVVLRLTGQAEAALADYGSVGAVLVADRALIAGEVLADGTTWRERPLALIPPSAVTADDPPDPAATAATDLVEGEVIVRPRVRSAGAPGGIPPDHLALAIPTAPTVPAVRVADRVAVVAAGDPLMGSAALAVTGVVVEVSDHQVLVAVPAPDAPAVAGAIRTGRATLALAP